MAVALTGDAATQKETFDVPVIAGGTFLWRGISDQDRPPPRDHTHRPDSDREGTDARRVRAGGVWSGEPVGRGECGSEAGGPGRALGDSGLADR